jgi:CheY-like chemotaxis protein
MKRKLNCILLVDDNDSDNFIHKRVIEKAGIAENIGIAMNGKEALDFLTTEHHDRLSGTSFSQPELIFLDINMPIMDGWEFLEEYHKLPEEQKGKVVFIMLTTSLNPADKSRAETMIENGCFQYKPLTQAMIRTIMEQNYPDYI